MAIGKIFEIQGKEVIPKADCYIIKPLCDVIENYPPKTIAYLHYMMSMRKEDNPYADVPSDQRSEQILYDLKLEINPEDPMIKTALACVEEKYSTTFYTLYKGLKSMLDRIGQTLLTQEIDFSTREGNAGNITRFMEKYESLTKSFKAAYRDFEEEQGGGRARGGAELADDENEDY